jgi:glycine cleavage system regulatory protein
MKVNDIKALDYQTDGDLLTIPFAETSVEAVLALDSAVLTVKTDAGDTVEVLAGYALRSVTVDAKDPTSVTAVLTRAVDGTAAALDTISARLVESEKENKLLKAQIAAQSDRADFVEDCIAEMAMQVYNN